MVATENLQLLKLSLSISRLLRIKMSIKEEHRVLVETRFEINDRSDSSYRTLFRLFSITVSATDQILTAITNNSPYKSLLT